MSGRGVSIHDIDVTTLGADSPLRALLKRQRHGPKADREHEEQVALFAWADGELDRRPELSMLFAIPNWFGVRTAKQGARAKAEGRKSGVPDICLPVERGGYHSLYVELKAPGGKPSPAQTAWLAALRAQGHRAELCVGWEAARDVITAYLDGRVA